MTPVPHSLCHFKNQTSGHQGKHSNSKPSGQQEFWCEVWREQSRNQEHGQTRSNSGFIQHIPPCRDNRLEAENHAAGTFKNYCDPATCHPLSILWVCRASGKKRGINTSENARSGGTEKTPQAKEGSCPTQNGILKKIPQPTTEWGYETFSQLGREKYPSSAQCTC